MMHSHIVALPLFPQAHYFRNVAVVKNVLHLQFIFISTLVKFSGEENFSLRKKDKKRESV